MAGVLSLEDAMTVVAERGRLMQSMPTGSMMALASGPDAIESLVAADVVIAAYNSSNLTVVSGPDRAIDQMASEAEAGGITAQRLHTSHAFHSPMMEPIVAAFRRSSRASSCGLPRSPCCRT